jgi:hypothetical protein
MVSFGDHFKDGEELRLRPAALDDAGRDSGELQLAVRADISPLDGARPCPVARWGCAVCLSLPLSADGLVVRKRQLCCELGAQGLTVVVAAAVGVRGMLIAQVDRWHVMQWLSVATAWHVMRRSAPSPSPRCERAACMRCDAPVLLLVCIAYL